MRAPRIRVLFARGFERMVFYGFRAIFTLYMVMGMHFSDERAYSIYDHFMMALVFLPLLGGLLGDLLKRSSQAAQLGMGMNFLGLLAFLFSGDIALYTGLVLIALGIGLFSSNIMALFGRTFGSTDERMDLWWALLYLAVNLGAFLAPILVGSVGEVHGWVYGFALASLFPLAAFFLLWDNTLQGVEKRWGGSETDKEEQIMNSDRKLLIVLALLIMSTLFWLFFQWGNRLVIDHRAVQEGLKSYFGSESMTRTVQDVWPTLSLILGLGFMAALWAHLRISTYYKLAFGLLVYGAVSALIIPSLLDAEASSPEAIASELMILFGAFSLCEALVVPSVNSLFTQLVPRWGLGTAYGLFILCSYIHLEWLLSWIGKPEEAERIGAIYGVGGIFIVLAAIFFYLGRTEGRSILEGLALAHPPRSLRPLRLASLLGSGIFTASPRSPPHRRSALARPPPSNPRKSCPVALSAARSLYREGPLRVA